MSHKGTLKYQFIKVINQIHYCFTMRNNNLIKPVTVNPTFDVLCCFHWSLGSSVTTVSNYGLDDRAIGVRSPAGAKDFSSNLCVQTGSGAHPASCTKGTGRDTDHSPPSSADIRNEWELYLLSPSSATMACSGTALLCLLFSVLALL
jgi:hypothetical protein